MTSVAQSTATGHRGARRTEPERSHHEPDCTLHEPDCILPARGRPLDGGRPGRDLRRTARLGPACGDPVGPARPGHDAGASRRPARGRPAGRHARRSGRLAARRTGRRAALPAGGPGPGQPGIGSRRCRPLGDCADGLPGGRRGGVHHGHGDRPGLDPPEHGASADQHRDRLLGRIDRHRRLRRPGRQRRDPAGRILAPAVVGRDRPHAGVAAPGRRGPAGRPIPPRPQRGSRRPPDRRHRPLARALDRGTGFRLPHHPVDDRGRVPAHDLRPERAARHLARRPDRRRRRPRRGRLDRHRPSPAARRPRPRPADPRLRGDGRHVRADVRRQLGRAARRYHPPARLCRRVLAVRRGHPGHPVPYRR
jgi:hypothetical protein